MRFSYILLFFVSFVSSAEKLNVFVSIPPQKYIVEQIGGEHVNVTSLLSEGDNPHSFTASPSVMKKLSDADVYFKMTLQFEKIILEKVKDYKLQLEFVPHDEKVKKQTIMVAHECVFSGCKHEFESIDPHFWISSSNAVKMAETSLKVLSKKLPGLKSEFSANFIEFKKRFSELHELNSKALKSYAGKSFYVYHPAFGYFAGEFGLKQKAVEVEGKKPSPRQLMRLIKEAKAAGIKTIVVQNQFNKRSAEKVAKAVGGNVVEINPLQEDLYKMLTDLGKAVKDGFEK